MAVGTGLPIHSPHCFTGLLCPARCDPRADRRRPHRRQLGQLLRLRRLGRLTGYYEETGLVDSAIGVLLVEEAGGIVTDWWGRGPEVYERTGTFVANPATHAYLMEMLGRARKVPVTSGTMQQMHQDAGTPARVRHRRPLV